MRLILACVFKSILRHSRLRGFNRCNEMVSDLMNFTVQRRVPISKPFSVTTIEMGWVVATTLAWVNDVPYRFLAFLYLVFECIQHFVSALDP